MGGLRSVRRRPSRGSRARRPSGRHRRRTQVPGAAGLRASTARERARRRTVGGVDEAPRGEVLVVAGENALELPQLARIVEGPGRQRRRGEARGADLLEGALEGPVEARADREARRSRPFGFEELGAGLLDESQRLRAREQAQTLARELRARDAERDRADGLDAEVDPGVALAREPLDERVSDRERRRDEDLFLQRVLAAGARERVDQPRGRLVGGAAARRGRRRLRTADRVVRFSGAWVAAFLSQSADRPCPGLARSPSATAELDFACGYGGSRLQAETGEPTPPSADG